MRVETRCVPTLCNLPPATYRKEWPELSGKRHQQTVDRHGKDSERNQRPDYAQCDRSPPLAEI